MVIAPAMVSTASERPIGDGPLSSAAVDATITASVEVQLPDTSFVPAGVGEAVMRVYDANDGNFVADGAFTSNGIGVITATMPAGDYVIEIASTDTRIAPVHEWWPNGRRFSDSSIVSVGSGMLIALGTISLEQREITVTRLAGASRYETAVALSQRAFPGTAPAVVIVNGGTFADALSAGPLANSVIGSMLLVASDSIPAATRNEITRLNPSSIYIVGGTGAVSPAVEQELRTMVASPSSVIRISGADRYATSRAVVERIGTGIDDLMIATGRNFPDALAAVPAANAFGRGALLLVDGTASSLDDATRSLLTARSAADFWIVGGTGSVSAALATDIATITPPTRLSGTDRYSTSVEVAFRFFVQADDAVLANGSGFADALAAGPVAAYLRAPVYLTQQDCVPQTVRDDIFSVFANDVVLAGGTGSLSLRVEQFTQC